MTGYLSLRERLFIGTVGFIVSAAIVFSCLPVPSAAASPKTSASMTVSQAAQRLDELNTQLETASEDLDSIQAKIAETKKKISEVKKSRSATEAKLEEARVTLADTVEETYKNGTVSYIEVLLGATSFDDFATKLYMLEHVAQSRSDAISEVSKLEAEYAQQESELNDSLDSQTELEKQASEKVTTVKSSISTSKKLYNSLSAKMRAKVNKESDRRAAAQAAASNAGQDAAQDAADGSSSSAQAADKKDSAAAKTTKKSSKSTKTSSKKASSGRTDSSKASSGSDSSADSGSTSTSGSHPGVVSIAKRYLGVKYVWGGASPKGFDCSGLVMYCYKKLGISLSHSSRSQYWEGERIARGSLMPGDLVFFGPNVAGIHHVGIYVGGGMYIHAPRTGDVVKISCLSDRSDYVGACRP